MREIIGTSPRSTLGMLLVAVVWCAPAVAVSSTGAPSSSDSSASDLPFSVHDGSTTRFTISKLTATYGRDLTVFLTSERPSPVDLDVLDRHGYFPEWDTPVDSTGTRHLRREGTPQVAELTPEEKRELDPPKPGVSTGIPSPVAVTGTLLGGLGLLIHVLTKLF